MLFSQNIKFPLISYVTRRHAQNDAKRTRAVAVAVAVAIVAVVIVEVVAGGGREGGVLVLVTLFSMPETVLV